MDKNSIMGLSIIGLIIIAYSSFLNLEKNLSFDKIVIKVASSQFLNLIYSTTYPNSYSLNRVDENLSSSLIFSPG